MYLIVNIEDEQMYKCKTLDEVSSIFLQLLEEGYSLNSIELYKVSKQNVTLNFNIEPEISNN